MDQIDELLAQVKRHAQGCMPLPVYKRIYDTAASCRAGTIVEVGTFCGAASVALALGARTTGRDIAIITSDILRPGVGPAGATVGEKIARLQATFARFEVADRIRFVHGTSRELLIAVDPRKIELLLLDGGGAIDADLSALWERLSPTCSIIIDDIDGAVRVRRNLRRAVVDQKHRLSKLIAERLIDLGLLVPIGVTGATGWYRKGAAAIDPAAIEQLSLSAYRALIKAEVGAAEFGLPRALLRRLAQLAPPLANAWRRLRPAG